MKNIGAVILAGGMSRRMGENKALLKLEGKTFLERIAGQLSGCEELLLSVDRSEPYERCRLRIVEDQYPDCGPIGGLYSALKACRSNWLFAVSCDMPLFEQGLAEYLSSFVTDDYDAYIAVTRDGWLHPLCAIYSQNATNLFEAQIKRGNYSLIQALTEMRTKPIPLRHSAYPDEMLSNINTPEQYRNLCRQAEGPPVVAISGIKNSGKTTLLEGILPVLRRKGLAVAVIKHDGHDFTPDVPGTDSYRLRSAGAYGVAVYSDYRYMLTAQHPKVTPKDLARQFKEADLILVEGCKHTAYPKLEVVRKSVSTAPISNLDTLLAVCTDLGLQIPGVPVLPIGDYEGIVELLLKSIHKEESLCMTAMVER